MEEALALARSSPWALAQQFMEEALADRADDSLTHLALKLTDFITYVMNQAFPLFQADCEPIEDTLLNIQDSLLQRFGDMYDHSELQLHKKIWDVLNYDKQGVPKEHSFVDWCRRIALHRTECTATNSAATKHNDPYKRMIKDIFANDLTPKQKNTQKYKLREGASITTEQRSLVNVILRKNLGDARIALFILAHGIPTALEAPRDTQSLEREAIEPMLDELMIWHCCLLQWLVMRQDDPNTIIARKLSDLNQRDWQAERRVRKRALQQEIRQATLLAELRDTNKKRLHQMSATEQRILEEYETGKLQKRHDGYRIQKPK